MITIQVDDKQVLDMLAELSRRMANLQPAMKEIGEDIVASTKRRFASSTSPDGTPWASNSQVTVERYLGVFAGSHKKDGTLSKRGAARSAAKKPLIGETKTLGLTINYQLSGTSAVHIGSPKVYAAMHQFGGTKTQFPHLWGDIPARPFLGLSAPDKANILDILGTYLVR
jgi:phage virion morphogenesis protein